MRLNFRSMLLLPVLLTNALPAAAAAQLDSLYTLMDAYTPAAGERYRSTARLFLDVSYTFCGGPADTAPVPAHVVRTDTRYYRSHEGIEEWKNYCFSIIRSIFKEEKKRAVVWPIAGRVYDADDRERFFKAAQIEGTDTANLPKFSLADSLWSDTVHSFAETKIAETADRIISLIVDSTDIRAREAASVLLDTIQKVKALYELKHRTGFRNRNIIEYFVGGSIETFLVKKQKGLLTPPGPYELILLSKPLMTAGTGSLYNNAADSNNVYILVPMLGVDRFSAGYKQYFGISIFSAVPLNARPYRNAYWGAEAHFSNKALIGYGWKIPDFSMQKIFLTIPIVGGWGWFN